MTVKIKVSYERQEELKRLLDKLGDDVKYIRAPRIQEGKFKKAYIDIRDE